MRIRRRLYESYNEVNDPASDIYNDVFSNAEDKEPVEIIDELVDIIRGLGMKCEAEECDIDEKYDYTNVDEVWTQDLFCDTSYLEDERAPHYHDRDYVTFKLFYISEIDTYFFEYELA